MMPNILVLLMKATRQACSKFQTAAVRFPPSKLILVGWSSIRQGVRRGTIPGGVFWNIFQTFPTFERGGQRKGLERPAVPTFPTFGGGVSGGFLGEGGSLGKLNSYRGSVLVELYSILTTIFFHDEN